jgi:hypothetical protein
MRMDRRRTARPGPYSARMVTATRRLRARPTGSSFEAMGWLAPRPTAARRPSCTPLSTNRRTTVLARTADSSQFEGKAAFAIGVVSVCPSTSIACVVLQQAGHRLQGLAGVAGQGRIAFVEQHAGVDLDGDAARILGNAHLAAADQRRQRRCSLRASRSRRSRSRLAAFGTLVRDDVRQRQRLDLDRGIRRGGGAAPAEGVAEGIRQHLVLADVDHRDRVHHDEEGEQQRDEIGVGDQPALVVFVGVVFVAFWRAMLGTAQ